MLKFKHRTLVAFITLLTITASGLLGGCGDRDDQPEDTDLQQVQANDALNRAQAAMDRAGISINFLDIGALADLPSILPDPLELGLLEDPAAIQEAIAAMYEVLDALGENAPRVAQAPANPAQVIEQISNSDLAMVHVHLAYLYVLESVRILTIAGWGKDGVPNTTDDLFKIAFSDSLELEDGIYEFELTERGERRFDEISSIPTSRPQDFLREFRASERQAILDALVLLVSVSVKVLAAPDITDIDGQPIEEQTPQIDRTVCQQDALFHLEQALDAAEVIAPDLAEEFDEFNEVVADDFAADFLNQVSEWGFDVQNKNEVINRINGLIER